MNIDLDIFVEEFRTDLAGGDRTSTALGLEGRRLEGLVVAREPLVVAGSELCQALPERLGLDIHVECKLADGARAEAGTGLARLTGDAAHILALERTLLNALTRLCSIATETRRWVDALPDHVELLDTRKTTPGLRRWERIAFAAGGGTNHRFSLADAIMIKDNHIAAVGSLREAVRRAVEAAPPGVRIACEVENLEQADKALLVGATALLVDNAPPETWPEYWQRVPENVPLEFSGGIGFDTLARIPAPPRRIWISASRPVFAPPAVDLGFDIA